MARQQTNKIIRGEEIQRRGGIGQSTRDTFPLLSLFFFHLVYFCLFCLFLHLKDLVSHVLYKGAGWLEGGGGGGSLPGGWLIVVCVCVCPCLCNYIPQIPIEAGGWAIIGLTMRVIFDYSFITIVIMSESTHASSHSDLPLSCASHAWIHVLLFLSCSIIDCVAELKLVCTCSFWKVPSSRQISFFVFVFFFLALKSFLVLLNLRYHGF